MNTDVQIKEKQLKQAINVLLELLQKTLSLLPDYQHNLSKVKYCTVACHISYSTN